MLALLPNVGPTEIFVLLLVLLFWAGVVAFVVFAAHSPLRKTGQGYAIATLVEGNKRLRDVLAERRGE